MPKGVPNKRYAGAFKQMAAETMMRKKTAIRSAGFVIWCYRKSVQFDDAQAELLWMAEAWKPVGTEQFFTNGFTNIAGKSMRAYEKKYGTLRRYETMIKILFVCHGRTSDKWAGRDWTCLIAANCGNSGYRLLPFYYRSADWKPYMYNSSSGAKTPELLFSEACL